MRIEALSEERAKSLVPQLIALLKDSVDNGASVGFLPPLAFDVAEKYWLEALNELSLGKRLLLVSTDNGTLSGMVQLALVTKPNALHRAEIQKLVVHTFFRNRGIARSLMNALEKVALKHGRTLLVLDTEQGSIAEKLYVKCGYTRAGVIPQYALGADRSFISTVIFYKLI
jgi:acetyltransferase